eukprot:symbB.v1.2.012239.t1/scaffold837.1/size158912/9
MQGAQSPSFYTGQYSGLPFCGMGTSLIRACCESLSQASAKGSSRRLEDLMIEVDEARKENQRLNRHVQEMRYELSTNAESSGEHRDNVARGEAEARPQRRVSKARNPEDEQRSGPVGQDGRQLQHLLSQLQRENAQLRAGPQVQRGRVSLSQYQHLQQQVYDLQRSLHQPSLGPQSVPSSYSYRGSRYASGRETPMSGVSSPQRQWGVAQYSAPPSETGTQGSAFGADDFRRRLSVMQRENDMLRNKAG